MIYQRLLNNFYQKEETIKFYIKSTPCGIIKTKIAYKLVKNLPKTFILKNNNNKQEVHLNINNNDTFAKINLLLKNSLATLQELKLIGKIRNEDFFVRSLCTTKILAKADRAIIPLIGTPSFGVHINCYQEETNKIYLAKRSANTYTYPNKLDNLVGGGVNASESIKSTMYKESLEEAFISKELAKNANFAEIIHYKSYNQNTNQIRNDYLFTFDLKLPKSFKPFNNDKENQEFLLISHKELINILTKQDVFKFNSELVATSFLLRKQLLKDSKLEDMIESMLVV